MANDSKAADAPQRWGLIGTLLWGLFIGAVFVFVQLVTMSLVLLRANPGADTDDLAMLVQANVSNGWVLSWTTLASGAVCLPLIVLAVKAKRGSDLFDHLGIRPVRPGVVAKWIVAVLVLGTLVDVIKWMAGLDLVPEFAVDVYVTRGSAVLFWLAFVVMAPLAEEVFFRGFLLAGLERTFLGKPGAVLATAATWAVIHTQYAWYDMLAIFMLGVLLGASRVMTGSLLPAVAIHMSMNLLAFVAAAQRAAALARAVY